MLLINRKYIVLLIVCIIGVAQKMQAQEKMTVNGTVKDLLSGESIIGAVIKIDKLANVTVTSNEYGFFAISLPKGKYDLIISFIGYEDKRISIPSSTIWFFCLILNFVLRKFAVFIVILLLF